MSLSMYQASVPVFIRTLKNLTVVLQKGEEFAKAKKIGPEVLLNDRLAPDMFTLARQILIATDIARRGAARLAGIDPKTYEDNVNTFADLYERINRTISDLESIKPQQIDGTEDKAISFEVGGNKMNFNGKDMLLNFSIPNVFFHTTITYAILRHNGVDVGKADFLGKMQA